MKFAIVVLAAWMASAVFAPGRLSSTTSSAQAPGRAAAPDASGDALLAEPSGGGIVAIGGGKLPDRIYARILALSGRQDPVVLVLPLATAEPDVSGPRTEQRFRECGAKRVDWLFFHRDDANKATVIDKIRGANIVFFPGGDQKKILDTVRDSEAARAIHDVAAKGGVVGGTSAGCEVLGDLSLTGSSRIDLAVVGSTQVEPGFALVPGVVFDQHFLRRGRFLRLLSATLDAPKKVGIGVDESTAAVFPHGSRAFEVVGERQVTVFRLDESSAAVNGKAGDLSRASNVRLHLLAEGDRYDLDKNLVTFGAKGMAAPPAATAEPADEDVASRKSK